MCRDYKRGQVLQKARSSFRKMDSARKLSSFSICVGNNPGLFPENPGQE